MRKIGFIADFYTDQINGGGENNDSNLINFLRTKSEVYCYRCESVCASDLEPLDVIVVGNFVMLSNEIKQYLMNEKKYIIYEHDHKYVNTRDPSVFPNFKVPEANIINRDFYESSHCTVVLSEVCKRVMLQNMPNVNVKSIGCSLWSESKFSLLSELAKTQKNGKICVMGSDNPTKNYLKAVAFCKSKNLDFDTIANSDHEGFLRSMSNYQTFLFLPKVLETFSRICAEAKMMNLKVMTNKGLIGFFSEDYSTLQGQELIDCLKQKNSDAILLFEELIQ